MIDLGPHASYIIFAYLGVAALTIALVVRGLTNARHQQKRLEKLEAQGVRRRSDKQAK